MKGLDLQDEPQEKANPGKNRLEGVDIEMGSDLTPQQKATLKEMLFKNHSVFSTTRSELGTCTNIEHEINIKPGTKPIASRPYHVNPKQMSVFREEIENLLKDGIIEPSSTPWRSPVMLVPKKSGFRLVADFSQG